MWPAGISQIPMTLKTYSILEINENNFRADTLVRIISV